MDEQAIDYQDYDSADYGARLHHYPNPQYADAANSCVTGGHGWSQVPPQDIMFSLPNTSCQVLPVFSQQQYLIQQNHQLQQSQVTPVDSSVKQKGLQPLYNPSPNQLLQRSDYHHHHQPHVSSLNDESLIGENQLDSQVWVSGSAGSTQPSLALTFPPSPPPLQPDVQMKLCGGGDVQSVPELGSVPDVSHKSTSSESIESTADGVFSFLKSEVQNDQPESERAHGYFPSRAVFPGDYGFKVTFNSTSAAYSYSEQNKMLCVNRGVDFAAIFSFTTPPTPGLNVRTLVCTKNAEDFQKVGIVKTCALHKDKSSDHFLTTRNDKAHYHEHHNHSIITVPVDSLPECDLGPMCVYSCSCYSTCVVGKGANHPSLVIIFSLMDSSKSNVVGQDVIKLRCCACPNRDAKRSVGGIAKKRKKRGRSSTPQSSTSPQQIVAASLFPLLHSLPPQMNLVGDVEPDEEGCFTFTWRLRDRSIFNFLSILKEGHRRMENSS